MLNRSILEWCPDGFVIPDHPNDPRNEWIPDTICAVSCITPALSENSWRLQETWIFTISWIGIISLSIYLFTQLFDAKTTNHLIMSTVIYSGLLSCVNVWMGYYSPEEKYCYDNSIPLSMEDGISTCVFQGVWTVFAGLGIIYGW